MKEGSELLAYSSGRIPEVRRQNLNVQNRYGLKLVWKTPQGTNSLYCKVDMVCIEGDDVFTTWKIGKSDYFINENEPESPMELLAITCAESYYPVVFTVNKDGSFHDIVDLEQLQERFETHIPTLLQDFGGEIAEQYISQTQKALRDSSSVKEIITSDMWFSLFFAPIIGIYNENNRTKKLTVSLPFWGYEAPLLFNGVATLDLRPNEWQTHIVTYNGQLAMSYITPALAERYHPSSGTISLIYDLHMATHRIKNIQCKVSVNSADQLYELEMNGYELQWGPVE